MKTESDNALRMSVKIASERRKESSIHISRPFWPQQSKTRRTNEPQFSKHHSRPLPFWDILRGSRLDESWCPILSEGNVEKSTYCVEAAVFLTIAPMFRMTFSRFSAWAHLHFTMPFVSFLMKSVSYSGQKRVESSFFSHPVVWKVTGWPDQNSLSWSRFFIRASMYGRMVRRIDRFLLAFLGQEAVVMLWYIDHRLQRMLILFTNTTEKWDEGSKTKRIRYSLTALLDV